MKILLINHYSGSETHGMEYRPHYLARKWVQAGHEVTIVAASFSHLRMRNPEFEGTCHEETLDGVRFLWLKTPKYEGNGVGRIVNMLTFIARLYGHSQDLIRWKPDLVIASSTYPLDAYPAYRIAKKSGGRSVFEVHDLWPLSPIELGGMSPSHPFIQVMQIAEDYAYGHCDRLVSILSDVDAYMRTRGYSTDKFIHIPNGIDQVSSSAVEEPLNPEHLEVLTRLRSEGKFIVGYAGSHGLANALDSFILAGKYLLSEKFALVLVGQGPEKEALKALAQTQGLENVHFLSPVPKKQVGALLSHFDVTFTAAKNKSIYQYGISANKIFDYMQAAKPIIHSSNVKTDLVQKAHCGISVAPESPKAIAQAIIELAAKNPEELRQIGDAGRTYVQTYHTYDYLAQAFLTEVMK